MKTHKDSKNRRKNKIRSAIQGTAGLPRLSVFRSNRYIYVQAIDDLEGKTLAAVSSLDQKNSKKPKVDESFEVGKSLGQLLIKNKIDKAVFDRGYYRYHGRVEKLADGIREAGIKF